MRRAALMRVPAVLAACVALAACAAQGDADPASSSAAAIPLGDWRGDVSYPGLPAIGVRFVLDDDGARMIAARNMGFEGGPLAGFRATDDSIRFRWSLNEDAYDCALRRVDDGTFLGPCTSEGEPNIGVRMVPPGNDAPTGLKRTLLEMSSVHWVTDDTGLTHVYVAADERARVNEARVDSTIAAARVRNAALFGDAARALPLDVFLVEGRDRMRQLVGLPAGGWTDPMAATVVIARYGDLPVSLTHEITHAISFNAWGPPHEGTGWLREGLATWVAGECAGMHPHDLARDMRAHGQLLPLRTLIDDFPNQNDLVTYLESTSVVGYLIETYRLDAFRRVWIGGEDGLRAMDLGVTHLERDWLRFLDARPEPASIDWDALRETGCG